MTRGKHESIGRLALSWAAVCTLLSAQQFRITGEAALAEPLLEAFKAAAADVNADGRPDLLIASAGGVIVLTNPGNGPWPPGKLIALPEGCSRQNIAAADFDGDGLPDFAAYCFQSGLLAAFRGDGRGGFELRTRVPLKGKSSYARGLLAADLNQDGFVDLVLGQPGNLTILTGRGDGTFELASELRIASASPAPATPAAIAAADFNADGVPDLAAVNLVYNDELSVFLGAGAGLFGVETKVQPGCRPSDVAAVDFNLDGKPDLALACNAFMLLEGRGDGSFARGPRFAIDQSPMSVAAGDLNADGLPDFVVGNYYGGEISILMNDGNSVFRKSDMVASIGDVFGVTLADFDGDGVLDLAAPSFSGDSALTAAGRGDGTFQSPTYYGTYHAGTFSLTAADLEPDGRTDLVVVAEGRKSVYLGTRGTESVRLIALDGYPIDARVADVTLDGIPDLVVASTRRLTGREQNDFGAAIDVYPGGPDGQFGEGIRTEVDQCRSSPEPPPPGYIGPDSCMSFTSAVGMLRVQLGDFTGDGVPQIALLNQVTGQIKTYAVEGGGNLRPLSVHGRQIWSFTVGDWNGDGMADLATVLMDGRSLLVYSGSKQGLRETQRYTVCGQMGLARSLAAGDFNGDGTLDLAALCGSEVDVLLNSGTSTLFQSTPIVTERLPNTAFTYAAVADFNGDGKADLAVPSESGLAVYLNSGDATFSTPSIVRGAIPLSLHGGDLDGRGSPEIALVDMDGKLKILTSGQAGSEAATKRQRPPI